MQLALPEQHRALRCVGHRHERAIGYVGNLSLRQCLLFAPCSREVKCPVDVTGRQFIVVALGKGASPSILEANIVGTPAFSTWPMARSERDGLVMEEKRSVPAPRVERHSTVTEFGPASNPGFTCPTSATERTILRMKVAAITHK